MIPGALALPLLLLAAAPAPGLDPAKAITQYNLDVWTTERGLPQNTVTALAQTRDGYLWVGSFGGLARFDGARFVGFDKGNVPSLRNSGVHVLLPDARSGLWIGTNGGGLSFLDGATSRTYGVADGLAGDVVRALFQDRRGRLWVGTNNGLSLLEDGRLRSWGVKEGFCDSVVRAIREDASGALWIGTNGDGLFRFEDGRFRNWTRKDGLPSDFVFSLELDADGALWIGTNGGGLARYADGRFRVFGQADGLGGDIIWSLSVDPLGTLWAGTYGAGLFRKKGERFEGLGTHTGLGSDFVRALWPDREGSLWIGTTTGGLARLRDGKFTTYTAREGLPAEVAKTVLADATGALWIGTSGGGVARLEDGRIRVYDRRQGLPHELVQALLIDRRGALWVGTNGGGIARLERGRFRAWGSADGLADDHVATLSEDDDGAIWVGTNAGGLSRFKDGRFESLGRKDGLGADLILSTLVDRSGVLWVGTDGGGMTRVEHGQFRTFTSADGLAADSVLSLYEDAERTLWIGTSGGGLSILRDGRLASVSTKDGLHDDVVFAVVEDDDGGLWLSGNRGLSRLEKRALLERAAGRGGRLEPEVYGVADGMKSNECSGVSQPAATRLPDGRLVFATTRGIVVVDPRRIPRNRVVAPVRVEELLAGGASHPGPRVVLEPGLANWEIRFTALSLLAPERVRFRYRLDGFERDWTSVQQRRSAFYTQVPPGRYVFEVLASNNDGVWSETPARLEIELRPRFHQTRGFLALAGAALLLLVGSGYRLRVRGLEARRRELERLVEERTHALSEQRRQAEAARLDAERQREKAERQREIAQRANSVKGELLSIAAHDLKNPLQLILGHVELAELQLEQGKPVADLIGHVHDGSQRMLGILESLLDAAATDAGSIQLAREPVELGALARHVVEASRASAARKRQTLELVVEAPLHVDADEERLTEIAENLIGNAIKYSPPGALTRVVVREQAGRALLEVIDSGPGLSNDDKQKLFRRFQRLSAVPTGGESSTGLGLAIAKRLAELMDGELRGDSDGPGRGARFTLSLPRSG